MATKFTFEQIKINQNENLNNPVINRALKRLFENQLASQSSETLPSTTGLSATSLLVGNKDAAPEWKSFTEVAQYFPTFELYRLSDVSPSVQSELLDSGANGKTIVWNFNNENGYWGLGNIPKSLNDLTDVSIVSPQDYQNLTYRNNTWTNATTEQFIGVGYIKHIICQEPTIIVLPTDLGNLSGNEQIEITKIIPQSYYESNLNDKYPILIVSDPDGTSGNTIIGQRSILTNNDSEPFASIHLRAVENKDANGNRLGTFTWIPVSMCGTWKPSDASELIIGYDVSETQTINTPAQLTSNELKIQPYNLDINLIAGAGGAVSKTFEVKMAKVGSIWTNAGSDAGVNISHIVDDVVIEINHQLMAINVLVKADAYYIANGRATKIMPDDIYFNSETDYNTICLNVNSWTDLADTLNFKVIVSV